MEKVTLTTNVTPETLERLRTLAGSPRKVGSFLDQVVDWLWPQRLAIYENDLAEFRLVTAEELGKAEQYKANIERTDKLQAEIDEIRLLVQYNFPYGTEYHRAIVAFLAEQTGVTPEEIENRIAEARHGRLQAQEDSGDNDA